MKKIYCSIILSIASYGVVCSQSSSQIVEGVFSTSISPNGEWIMGQADGEGLLYFKNLKEDKVYLAGGNTSVDGTGYIAPLGCGIANNGTAIALVNGIPYWWTPEGTNGKWTKLPGNAVDGSAALGSITPDGSVIVGATGNSGTTTEDVTMAKPCIWYRNADGSFGEPVMLPYPPRDPFNLVPEYVVCIGVSEDVKTITALMTDWTGKFAFPYIYTQEADGNWNYEDIGSGLLIPDGREIPEFPGDLHTQQPDPEQYLTQEGLDAFWDAFPAWAADPEISRLPLEEQTLAQLEFTATFMEENAREEYLELLYAYLDEIRNWNAKNKAYTEFLEEIVTTGTSFLGNNSVISLDGKYAYFTGRQTIVDNPALGEEGIVTKLFPIRFDLSNGEILTYVSNSNIIVTSVANDYTLFCRQTGIDNYWPTSGWVFPEGDTKGMTVPDFIKEKGSASAYSWMEENMYQEVIVGVSANDAFIYDDAWTVGVPYCSSDLGLIVFANSTLYWAEAYFERFNFVSFLLNTGISGSSENKVDKTEVNSPVKILANGEIAVDEDIEVISIFNVSGMKLLEISNPSTLIKTDLTPGIYILTLTDKAGNVSTIKTKL